MYFSWEKCYSACSQDFSVFQREGEGEGGEEGGKREMVGAEGEGDGDGEGREKEKFYFKTVSLSRRRNSIDQWYLLSTCFVPGIVFGAGNTVFNKTFKVHALKELRF